jgi:hypothetical protein
MQLLPSLASSNNTRLPGRFSRDMVQSFQILSRFVVNTEGVIDVLHYEYVEIRWLMIVLIELRTIVL